MTTYFVSRHPGAEVWAKEEGIEALHIQHLDPAIVKAGDVVIGTLPIHLAADVCSRGARFMFLALDLPREWRDGRDLTADEMRAAHARLEEYVIRRA